MLCVKWAQDPPNRCNLKPDEEGKEQAVVTNQVRTVRPKRVLAI